MRAKTCCPAHRLQRSRRIRRANREVEEYQEQHNAADQEVAAIVRGEAPDVIKDVMRAQLGPVVREALTEDVLRAVQSMLGLTPKAVELLREDMESDDKVLRQRAYMLVTKYTIGHPALLQHEDASGSGQLTVNFNLPRPTDDPTIIEVDVLPDEELKTCDMCNAEKPSSEFVAESDRCQDCFEKWKASVLEQFAS